jgi:hypothetical protein
MVPRPSQGGARATGGRVAFSPAPLLRASLDAAPEGLGVLTEATGRGASRQADRHKAAQHDADPHPTHCPFHLFSSTATSPHRVDPSRICTSHGPSLSA